MSLVLEQVFVTAHLMVHFQLQYFLVIVFLSFILLVFKKFRIALPALVYAGVLYFVLLHPVNFFAGELESVDIFYMNTHYSNQNVQPIVDEISNLSPEVTALVESNPEIVKQLNLSGRGPIINHRAHASSCTVYAEKFISARVEGQTHLPLCIVQFAGFDLITVHAHRPLGKANIKENVEFFDQILEVLEGYERQNKKFVLVGDFNASRYSVYFRSRFGKYVQSNTYTWMTNTPFALPIDHVMSNMELDFVRSRNLGSDHRALLIKLKSPQLY